MPSGGVIARWSIPSSRNHSLNGTPRRASSRRSGSTQASFSWITKTRGVPTLAKCCTFMNLLACGSDECDTAPNIGPNAAEKKTLRTRVKGRKAAGRLLRTIPGPGEARVHRCHRIASRVCRLLSDRPGLAGENRALNSPPNQGGHGVPAGRGNRKRCALAQDERKHREQDCWLIVAPLRSNDETSEQAHTGER